MRRGRATAAMRQDRMTVYRVERAAKANGGIAEVETEAYADVPCHLSFAGTATPEDDARIADAEFVATIFHAPELTLQRNDRIVVTRCGTAYAGYAGITARYPTHGETPLAIHRR